MVCLFLTSLQQLRSYGDRAKAYSLIQQLGGAFDQTRDSCVQVPLLRTEQVDNWHGITIQYHRYRKVIPKIGQPSCPNSLGDLLVRADRP